MQVQLAGHAWHLLPQRAALWKSEAMLVVADVHIGKAVTFRARGVPVPSGTTAQNLRRLSQLVAHTQARVLVFLGDLLHAREAHANETLSSLRAWREQHAQLSVLLIEGNHDRSAGALPPEVRIESVQEPWIRSGIALCHHPQLLPGQHVIAGHLHPCVQLSGRAGDSVRLPCFWLRSGLTIVPAFGEFTGGATIQREPGDRVIAFERDKTFEVPPPRALRRAMLPS